MAFLKPCPRRLVAPQPASRHFICSVFLPAPWLIIIIGRGQSQLKLIDFVVQRAHTANPHWMNIVCILSPQLSWRQRRLNDSRCFHWFANQRTCCKEDEKKVPKAWTTNTSSAKLVSYLILCHPRPVPRPGHPPLAIYLVANKSWSTAYPRSLQF